MNFYIHYGKPQFNKKKNLFDKVNFQRNYTVNSIENLYHYKMMESVYLSVVFLISRMG